MTSDSIIFPGLNIALKSVGRGFDIFGFTIAFYGVVIAVGMLLAASFISWNANRRGESKDTFYNMTILGIICGVIGARVYYIAFSWDLYKGDLISMLNLRAGGLAIYGGIIGGALLVILYSKKNKIKVLRSGDIVLPGVLIGQICGRWGNFFNREAFGGYTDSPFRMGLPVESVRSISDITEQMRANSEIIDGIEFVFVHPTFLYESLWNLCVLIILVLVGKKDHNDGLITAMYFIFYGVGRFFIESLRTDQLLLPNTQIPVSMVVSVISVLTGLCIIVFKVKRKNPPVSERI